MDVNEGYLLCVFGDTDKYYKLAIRLIKNIRKFDSYRSICVLTDDVDQYQWPERVILKKFELDKYIHEKICHHNSWNKYGLYPKVFQSLSTPFQNTMYIDADMIFIKDFTFMWNEYYSSNQMILMPGKSDENNRSPGNWHWGHINDVIDKSGIMLPQCFSTLIVYNNSFKEIVTKDVVRVFDNLSNWDVRSFFRGGYPDEIIYSFLLGINNLKVNIYIHDWIINIDNCDATNKDE